MKLEQGLHFGQWILKGEKPLGKGGNGVVWEAENSDGNRAAIKFLQSHHFGGIREKRFRLEIDFLKNEAKRPGILPIIDFHLPVACSETDRIWFATPLAIPFTDSDLSGNANLQRLVQLVEIVSQNLAKLHDEAKWHRDLKPENLFIIDGSPLIGDFGLVDFPDKDAITTKTEIVGPLFYVAPEMMQNAENTQAGPGDVYSLSKTLWVLATGQRYPLPGEQRVDNPALRLSTYCRHEHAHILDLLMERSTSFEPTRRPTMKEFSKELSEWLKVGTDSAPVSIDLSALIKECQGVFESGIIAERNEDHLIQNAHSVLVSFDHTLERMSAELQKVTKITPVTSQTSLYKRFHFPEYIGAAKSIWRQAHEVRITTKIDPIEVYFQGYVQVEALNDNRIRILVGYLGQPVIHGSAVMTKDSWKKESIAPAGSAQLTNDIATLQIELLENLAQAIREYVLKVKQLFKN
jgi:serine/threonine protein kinase